MRNHRPRTAVKSALAALGSISWLASAAGPSERLERLDRLDIVRPLYPRAFFFRVSEGLAANPRISFEEWDAQMSRLSGIIGKVLDEEVPGRSRRNIDFFTRFKQRHPEQVVLLHYNGNARDPRDAGSKFFAGHWVYWTGCKITRDLPAVSGESELYVEDPRLFRTGIGRYGDKNEDIGICMLDPQGKPDWSRSEQVQLLAVDVHRKMLRVRRGCYGTEPRRFPAGKAYAAAHVSEGPWGRRSHLLWFYNFSTRCPKDSAGCTCTDVLLDELTRLFSSGGLLAAFDGLEFDVLAHRRWQPRPTAPRGIDTDGDGRADYGFFEGRNEYGIGVYLFLQRLRRRLGPDRLILADGHGPEHQRGVGQINGIESEGWPSLSDWEIRDWSGGLNRHFIWASAGYPPPFSYINHKFIELLGLGRQRPPKIPFARHRLVFAAAMFTDSAICYSFPPPRQRGAPYPIWDELWAGQERRLHWLGRPLAPARRLAGEDPDVLHGLGAPPSRALAKRIAAEAGVSLRFDSDGALVAEAAKDAPVRFILRGVPCRGPDLTLRIRLAAAPLPGYPPDIPRLTWVGVIAPEWILVRAWPAPRTGMCLRGDRERPLDPTTGAQVRYLPDWTVGDRALPAYFCHPPWRTGRTGYVYWEREVLVPRNGILRFAIGMGQKSPERSDGVLFRVLVLDPENPEKSSVVFERRYNAFRWEDHEVSLARWAEKRIVLRFVSDAGPRDDSTTDHSAWGDVRILPAGPEPPRTRPEEFMTWTRPVPFESWFTFREVRTDSVDIAVEVEGGAPVRLLHITAFAAPDAMVREFEHGVVLANPSLHPYRFDLSRLFPGQRFRRIPGSPEQDPAVNDGRDVRDPVLTIGDRDALFLLKTP